MRVSPCTFIQVCINNCAIQAIPTICTCRQASRTDCNGVHQHSYLQNILYAALCASNSHSEWLTQSWRHMLLWWSGSWACWRYLSVPAGFSHRVCGSWPYFFWMDLKRRQKERIISESSADSWKYRAVDVASRRLQTYRRRKNSPEEGRIYGTWNSHSPLIQSYEQLWWRGGLRRWREDNFSILFSCDERFRHAISTKV